VSERATLDPGFRRDDGLLYWHPVNLNGSYSRSMLEQARRPVGHGVAAAHVRRFAPEDTPSRRYFFSMFQ
jgi:hypothetical protein